MTVPVPEPGPSRRIALFDGLRGIALLLVVLSHLWLASPWMLTRMHDAQNGTGEAWSRALGFLFGAGNYAVSFFFVIGSFLVTRAMLRQVASAHGLRPGVNVVRRFVRLSGQLYFMLLCLVVIVALEGGADDGTSTAGSVLHSATYTWNWYVHDHLELARPDLGHLWYLAVDFQVFLIVLGLVWLLRRRPRALVLVLGAFWIALLFWRADIYDYDPNWALLRTWARGDAPVMGALAAALMPFLPRSAEWARPLTVLAVACLVPLLRYSNGSEGYFGWAGVALDLTLAAVVVGATLAEPSRLLLRIVGNRVLAFLGRHSLSVYLWHLPMIHLVVRHTADWREPARIGLAILLTVGSVLLSELLVERHVQRFLDSPRWRGTDDGLGRYLLRSAGSLAAWIDRRDEARKQASQEPPKEPAGTRR